MTLKLCMRWQVSLTFQDGELAIFSMTDAKMLEADSQNHGPISSSEIVMGRMAVPEATGRRP